MPKNQPVYNTPSDAGIVSVVRPRRRSPEPAAPHGGRSDGESGRATPAGVYIPALDGLRAIAILAVFAYHEDLFAGPVATSGIARAVHTASTWGWTGVDLFLVLSGFLITGILLGTKGSQHYFRTFYLRRVLRIFPAYYAFLALYFFVRPHLPGGPYAAIPRDQQLWTWTYLTNVAVSLHGWAAVPKTIAHFWSLAVEEQFYLFWPLLVFLFDRRGVTALCLAAIVAAFAIRVHSLDAGHWDAARILMPARVDAFAIGGLLALSLQHPGGRAAVARWSWPVAALAVSLTVALFRVWPGNLTAVSAASTSLAVAGGALIGAAATRRGIVTRVLGRGPLAFIGRYSYAFYIVHQPVIVGLRAIGFSPATIARAGIGAPLAQRVIFGLAAASVSLGAALVSWLAIERPFLALKRYVPYARSHAEDREVRRRESAGAASAAAEGSRLTAGGWR